MAKTYIDTVKYLVYTNVEVDGLVDKPDVVGAIFGQTEGLLGDELDLRDLQKNGRIGRIEVELKPQNGKTVGTIKIPSSLDMVETCIIAAALETVDRVGPCEAKLEVTKVEDTRSLKRKMLVDRAKNLLRNLILTEIPESKEITEMIREEIKTAEIVEYGPERLPAGPGIDKSNELILVEGRADVINLLKNDITNVIVIQGAKVPRTIVELSKRKEVTIFLDGDRGGDIILNELIQGGVEIDFIARAPTGLEVEELTRKELIKCLRGKVPFEQTEVEGAAKMARRRKEIYREEPKSFPMYEEQVIESDEEKVQKRETGPTPYSTPSQHQKIKTEKKKEPVFLAPHEEQPILAPPQVETREESAIPPKEKLLEELDQLSNTLNARIYNAANQRICEVPVRDVIKKLNELRDARVVIFDGIITQRLVDLAAKQGVKVLVGIKTGNVNKVPEGIEVLTKS
ncbi:MAG: DNA primase DnaG [Nitrososphaeria archaeon]